MNAISLTRHLLLKDMRHQRVWLALVWLAALLLPFAARRMFLTSNEPLVMGVFQCGFFLLIFLALARVVRLDPPERDFHFLATRPVAWNALLGGKILFIGWFLLVPVWIAKLGIIYTMKIPVSLPDIALLLLENAIHVGALLAVVLFFSMFLRGLQRIAVSMIAGAMAIGFGAAYFENHFRKYVFPRMPDFTLIDCQHLMFWAGIIVTVGAAAILRYRGKSIRGPLAVAVAGLALSALAWNYWPLDLSRFFQDKPQNTGELPSALRDRITFTLTDVENRGDNEMVEAGWNKIMVMSFHHDVSLEGVEPPYFATLVDFDAVATLKSGHTISSSFGDGTVHGEVGGLPDDLLRQMVGLTPKRPREWSQVGFEIFSYLPGLYQNEDLTGASIKGTITLEIHKVSILKTIPFKSGAWVDTPRRHYMLEDIDLKPDGIAYKFLTPNVTSVLRGDLTGFQSSDDLSRLAYNRNADFLSMSSSGRNGGEGILYNVLVHEETLARDSAAGNAREPIPADWAEGAEITFFTSESCGRISFPYEIKSVDLRH